MILKKTLQVGEKFWRISKSSSDLEKLFRIFAEFRANKIEPILIKGWVTAQNYPARQYRNYVDFDLAVRAEDYPAAKSLIESDPNLERAIDLHRGLRDLDELNWNDLYCNSLLIGEGAGAIRVLRPEDHLRVICVHWLMDGGAYRERLWDIYYAVVNRPSNFEWDRFLYSVKMPHRKWITDVLFLAEYYLDLDLRDTPLKNYPRKLPFWLIREIESEWKSELRLSPLVTVYRKPKEFCRQIKKRFPPNALQATVECRGSFDETSRLKYQIKNIWQRV